jgi:hypothetical protein
VAFGCNSYCRAAHTCCIPGLSEHYGLRSRYALHLPTTPRLAIAFESRRDLAAQHFASLQPADQHDAPMSVSDIFDDICLPRLSRFDLNYSICQDE